VLKIRYKGGKNQKNSRETFFILKVSGVLRRKKVYPSVYMETKEKILGQSEELFMRFGIKSITMDEVARHCNISKKTIYQYFPDKDALVKEVMERHMQEDICMIQSLYDENCSALEEVLKISEFMNKDMSEIHPSVLFDLKKYHSAAYEVFEKHRDTHFMDTVARNLERGIQEGVYRKEIDVKVFARLRVIEIEAMFNPGLLNGKEFNPARVQLLFIDHFVRGLVTPKGLEEWERISQPLFQVIR
jgi:AcrR family transcriptional regulator